ncbi:MAG: glycosyltransferase [Spartobacteria bacterium]|nr:glycosyltransferase [Spartobacteria bacterium]
MSAPSHISVIMPSYNQGPFIREAIESVLSQSWPRKSLHIMDGGSTDETVDILKSFGKQITFLSEKDDGQSDAINRGIFQADSDIVCWLNSDDTFAPDALARVMTYFERHPEADFVYGRGWNMDEAGRQLDEAWVKEWNLWRLIHHKNFIQQPSCFFRKKLFEDVGGLDLSLDYVMDWDLWIKFGAYQHGYIDECLSFNRVYPANKTASGGLKRWKEIRRMTQRYTPCKWPPVLYIYFYEIMFQRAALAPVRNWAMKRFVQLMHKPYSGVLADGKLAEKAHLSAGNPGGKSAVKLTFRSSAKGLGSEIISWRNSCGSRDIFTIKCNGEEQSVALPLDRPSPGNFTHFTLSRPQPQTDLFLLRAVSC